MEDDRNSVLEARWLLAVPASLVLTVPSGRTIAFLVHRFCPVPSRNGPPQAAQCSATDSRPLPQVACISL